MKKVQGNRYRGFGLIEMMITLVVLSILLLVAMPAYQGQLRKTWRRFGAAELFEIVMRQEEYFADHKVYAGDLKHLGLPSKAYGLDRNGNRVAPTSAARIYIIELSTSGSAYSLRAVPQGVQTQDKLCGWLSINSRGERQIGGTGVPSSCW